MFFHVIIFNVHSVCLDPMTAFNSWLILDSFKALLMLLFTCCHWNVWLNCLYGAHQLINVHTHTLMGARTALCIER